MDMNLIIFAMTVLLMGYMVVNRVNMFIDHRKALEDINHRGDFKKMFTGHWILAIYALAFTVSVSAFIVFYINRDLYENYVSWLLVFAVIVVTSATDMLRTVIIYTTYYNDQGIFHNTDFFRYNSVKNFKLKRPGLSTEVFLFNGNSYFIPTKGLKFLEDRIVKSIDDKNNNRRK